MSLAEDDRKTARKKGLVAAATGSGAVVLLAASYPVLGVIALGSAAYLGWNWFSYRAKRGMRF